MSGFDRVDRGTRRRRITLVLVAAVLTGLAAWVGFDVWAGRQVDRRIARLEGRYGSLDESTLEMPPVPAGDNRARIVRAAAALVIPGESDSHRTLVLSLNQEPPAPVSDDDRAFAEANQAAVLLAREIGTRRQSSWDVDPLQSGTRAYGLRFPAMDMRVLSDAISMTARLELDAGRADEAAQTIASGLAVAASVRREPWLLAQLVRHQLARLQLRALQRLLEEAEPSASALEDLARWIAENREPDAPHAILLAELKHGNAALARLEAGDIDETPAEGMSRRFRLLLRSRLGRPFVRLARARYLQHMDELLEVQDGPRPQPPRPEPPASSRWAVADRLVYQFTNGLNFAVHSRDEFVGHLGAAEVAVALRRFRLDHGAYPDELSALVPAYLDAMPINPFTGRPPDYERHDAGFTLRLGYSMAGGLSPDWDVAR